MLKFNIPYLSGKESSFLNKVIAYGYFSGNNNFSKKCEVALENKYGFNKCFLTTSCTAAIEMTSLILDLKPNDEIIIPSYTFASCPNPFLIKGNKVVLIDCDKDYPNVSAKQIETAISPKTKALMIMHYGGVACKMEEIKALCEKHNIYLIEDAAQCIHSFYQNKPLGSYGDLSVFSFHETKNIHCGEGGLLVINNLNLLEKAENVRQYGTNRKAFLEGKINHYESVDLGLAFFQSELNAAFLYSQIQDIEKVTLKRKELWKSYYKALKSYSCDNTFKLCNENVILESNAHIFFITLNKTTNIDDFLDFLNKREIQAVKHFYPLHLSQLHQKNIPSVANFPNTNYFNKKLVRLPLHNSLTQKDIEFIAQTIAQYFSK